MGIISSVIVQLIPRATLKSNLLGRFFYAQKSSAYRVFGNKITVLFGVEKIRIGDNKNYPKESRGVCTITIKNIKTPEKSVFIELFGGSFLFRGTVMGLKNKII